MFLGIDIDNYYEKKYIPSLSTLLGELKQYEVILEANNKKKYTKEELEIISMVDINGTKGYLVQKDDNFIDDLYTRITGKSVEKIVLTYDVINPLTDKPMKKELEVKSSSVMLLPKVFISKDVKFFEQLKLRNAYINDSVEQLILSNWSGKVTLAGTAGQMVLGFTGLDAPTDVGDFIHNITHWERTWSHAGETVLNGLSILPVVGMLKCGDEVGVIVRKSDGILELRKLNKLENLVALKKVRLLDEFKTTAKNIVQGAKKLGQNTYEQFLLGLKKTFNMNDLEDFLAFDAVGISDELFKYGDEVEELAKYYPIEFQESVSKIAKRVNQVEDVGHVKKIVKEEVDDLKTATRGEYSYIGKSVDEIADYYYDKVKDATKATGGIKEELIKVGVRTPPYKFQSHHIIPKGETYESAKEAREILDDLGIDVDSACNGVNLPDAKGYKYAGNASPHYGKCTKEYCEYVLEELNKVNISSKNEVIAVIHKIRKDLLEGKIKINDR